MMTMLVSEPPWPPPWSSTTGGLVLLAAGDVSGNAPRSRGMETVRRLVRAANGDSEANGANDATRGEFSHFCSLF